MEIDELKLLAGVPYEIEGFKAHCPTIRDIMEIGESEYQTYLGALSLGVNSLDIREDNASSEYDDLEDIDVIFLVIYNDEYYKNTFLKALRFFLKDDFNVSLSEDGLIIYAGRIEEEKYLSRNTLEYVLNIIKIQNCIINKDNIADENPSDERAKRILEKMKEAREKLAKVKNKNGDGSDTLSFSDLVSILCSNGNGINPFNVWDLNIYMFNNQFNRMKMLEDYDINIRSLLAGADSEKIDLKHWMSKIT